VSGGSKSRLDLSVQPGMSVGGATLGMRPREPEPLECHVLSVIEGKIEPRSVSLNRVVVSQPVGTEILRFKSRSSNQIVFGYCRRLKIRKAR
jgi:hypothetical protein